MEISQLLCDGDLFTGSCVVLVFAASNFCTITSLLLFSLFHHSLQNQDEIALQEMIVISISIVPGSINIV